MLPKMLLSELVYKYKCGGSMLLIKGRSKVISHLTEKKVKIDDNNKLTAIQEYLLRCNYYSPSLEDFSILTWETNDFKLKTMDSLLIASD